MDGIAKDTIALLQFLLPGFLAAWVFYALTSYPRPNQFERVVQALILTLIAQAVALLEKASLIWLGNYWILGTWSKESELLSSIVAGLFIGLAFSYFANNDTFHKILRKARITRETSYPSEWFGTFLTRITFIVLHFKDERRMYGWPLEWPSDPKSGHFLLVRASWLDGEKEIPITGVESVLVNVEEVRMIEFMDKLWEKENGKERVESSPAVAVAETGDRETRNK